MQDVVDPARFFHERFALSGSALERVLGTALARRADYADCYFEFRATQTASLEDGVVRKATRHVGQGVGVRVLAGPRSGYAHSDEVTFERLELAARTAAVIADERGGTSALSVPGAPAARHDLYPLATSPVETPLADTIALLSRIDAAARAVDPCITSVLAGIGLEHRVVLVAGSAGTLIGDVRPLLHLSVTCIAERGGVRQQGTYGGGGRFAFATLDATTGAPSASRARRRGRRS
jgi:TldD protein